MAVVNYIQEVMHNALEQTASYRLGQTALRYADRALWVVEKCARWAVPPPLDQDDRPQPELIRPLPWVLFLPMLVLLRITRESISLINLVLGKPPLRSADVVMFIQHKRRYIRTLKYQGSRIMRTRINSSRTHESWFGLRSLFEFTMCFRRNSQSYGNNNTTRISNNEEILVVKRNKRGRQNTSPVASTSETSMERLIEKMMIDLDADSDDDSSYTLTNITSAKSSGVSSDSDQDTIHNGDMSTAKKSYDIAPISETTDQNKPKKIDAKSPETFDQNQPSFNKNDIKSTPEKIEQSKPSLNKSDLKTTPGTIEQINSQSPNKIVAETSPEETGQNKSSNKNDAKTPDKSDLAQPNPVENNDIKDEAKEKKMENREEKVEELRPITREDAALQQPVEPKNLSTKDESQKLLENEKSSPQKSQRSPKKEQKIANGRMIKGIPSKKRGYRTERRGSDVPLVRVTPADEAFDGGKENIRQLEQHEQ